MAGNITTTAGVTGVAPVTQAPHRWSDRIWDTQNETWWQGFLASWAIIMLSEIGDDTFWIVMMLAARKPAVLVFIGATAAMVLVTVLSSALGAMLPFLISEKLALVISASLWIFFGFRTLLKLWLKSQNQNSTQVDSDAESEMEEANERITRSDMNSANNDGMHTEMSSAAQRWSRFVTGTVMQSFSLTFFGDWGDPSQMATVTLASTHNSFGVAMGGIVGHTMATVLAVFVGKTVVARIPKKYLTLGSGIFFLAIGILAMVRVGVSSDEPPQ